MTVEIYNKNQFQLVSLLYIYSNNNLNLVNKTKIINNYSIK